MYKECFKDRLSKKSIIILTTKLANKFNKNRRENNMYLSLLNEKQKSLFLGLAYDLASFDGNFSNTEKMMISSYCQEMQMKFDQNNMVKPVNEIIEEMNVECGLREKKIIIFESIGLAISDGNYDVPERELIGSMIRKFNVEHDYAGQCENVLKEYITLQNKINRLVIE